VSRASELHDHVAGPGEHLAAGDPGITSVQRHPRLIGDATTDSWSLIPRWELPQSHRTRRHQTSTLNPRLAHHTPGSSARQMHRPTSIVTRYAVWRSAIHAWRLRRSRTFCDRETSFRSSAQPSRSRVYYSQSCRGQLPFQCKCLTMQRGFKNRQWLSLRGLAVTFGDAIRKLRRTTR